MSFNVFRAVQTAVAHDSLLKKVLTEQKDRNQSLRDLAKNNKKSAESLASWGVRDGDDLGTICGFGLKRGCRPEGTNLRHFFSDAHAGSERETVVLHRRVRQQGQSRGLAP